MNLDELRSVQNKERQKDSLQHLRDSFYGDVGRFIADLKAERSRAADRADDPFSSPEVQSLTDEIETAEEVAEAIYERRMGKLVKQASLAAADMPANEEGLTTEERELFDDMVVRIKDNKHRVLEVLSGGGDDPDESGTDDPTEATPPADVTQGAPTGDPPGTDVSQSDDPAGRTGEGSPSTGVDAADLMGAGSDDGEGGHGTDDETPPPPPSEPSREAEPTEGAVSADAADTPDTAKPTESDGLSGETARPSEPEPTAPEPPRDTGTEAGDGAEDTERTVVRITRDVGSILGVDQREYDLAPEDVVTLPTTNADLLLEKDAAERLE